MSESRGGSSGLLSCEETGSWVCWGVAVCVSLAVGSGAYACFFFSEGRVWLIFALLHDQLVTFVHGCVFASSQGYIAYGTGNFDGQGSGHNFDGNVWHPSHGYVNNCDGARSHWSCDYRQA
eukprot:3332203-Rhodomonas_salina.2